MSFAEIFGIASIAIAGLTLAWSGLYIVITSRIEDSKR